MSNFTPDIIAAAQKSQTDYGVPASVSLAQWAIESGYGAHIPPGSNNYFGIKATAADVAAGQYVTTATREVINGQSVMIQANFRKFASSAEAFDAHAHLLATVGLYAPAMAAWKAGDLAGGVRAMAQHYATDINYATTILSVIESQHLTQYDTGTSPQPVPQPVPPMPAHTVAQAQQRLKDLGYDPGPIDGQAGPLTDHALVMFQSARKLPATGKFDGTTLDALFTPPLPQETSMLSLLPTIVQWIIALLPGIPDDVAIVEAELKELASTDSGKVKLQTALTFGKTLIEKIEAVLAAHP